MNHNSIGRGYETWGNGTAETLQRTVPKSALTMEWYRPVPPPSADVVWSARDNLNYQETGSLAVLDYAAHNAKEMLRNFYQKGWDSWRKGIEHPPYAFVIPDDQGDRTRVAQMVGRLLAQHIEVSRAQNSLNLKEGNFPRDSYVVRQIAQSGEVSPIERRKMRKLIAFDDETMAALTQLGRNRMATLQELADEAFADLLKKHGVPIDLKDALRRSARIEKKKS